MFFGLVGFYVFNNVGFLSDWVFGICCCLFVCEVLEYDMGVCFYMEIGKSVGIVL